jgi:hypothetical protein
VCSVTERTNSLCDWKFTRKMYGKYVYSSLLSLVCWKMESITYFEWNNNNKHFLNLFFVAFLFVSVVSMYIDF